MCRILVGVLLRVHFDEVHADDAFFRELVDERDEFVRSDAVAVDRASRVEGEVEHIAADAEVDAVDVLARHLVDFSCEFLQVAAPDVVHRQSDRPRITRELAAVRLVPRTVDAGVDQALIAHAVEFIQPRERRGAGVLVALVMRHIVVVRIEVDDADLLARRLGERLDDRVRDSMIAAEPDQELAAFPEVRGESGNPLHRLLHIRRHDIDVAGIPQPDMLEHIDMVQLRKIAAVAPRRQADHLRPQLAARVIPPRHRALPGHPVDHRVEIRGVLRLGDVLRIEKTWCIAV